MPTAGVWCTESQKQPRRDAQPPIAGESEQLCGPEPEPRQPEMPTADETAGSPGDAPPILDA